MSDSQGGYQVAILGASSLLLVRRPYCRGANSPKRELMISSRYQLGRWAVLVAAIMTMIATSCGYRVAGRGSRLPPEVKSIAVPAFQNETPRFRIEQRLASALIRELIRRTNFAVTASEEQADAVLNGTVVRAGSRAIAFDLNTGRATTLQMEIEARVELVEHGSGKVLFSNPRYIFREQYQIDPNIEVLFEEDEAALERIAHDMARTLVSEILENF